MIVPFVLFLASGVAVFAAWAVQSPELLMVAGPAMLGSLWLWLKALVAGIERRMRQGSPSASDTPNMSALAPKLIMVDGSNVMHWKDNIPQLSTLREVLRALEARGYSPCVALDANAGYKLVNRYLHHARFGWLLDLPEERIMVVKKGEPADKTVLAAARNSKVLVVSNDRFRDWAKQFPEVTDPANFLRGEYKNGVLWLQPDPVKA